MIVGIIGDIHGHLPALTAVLAQLDNAGVENLVNTGDCVVGNPWSGGVIDILRDRNIPTAQGLEDRQVVRFARRQGVRGGDAHGGQFDSIRRAFESLSSDQIEFLRSLPKLVTLKLDGVRIAAAHGTPGVQSRPLLVSDHADLFRRQRERTNADVIACGQTHQAFYRWVDGTLFVNPGAVGPPAGRPRPAQYALVDTESTPWGCEIKSVPLDEPE